MRRPPDKTFGGTPERPYARRWHIIPKNRWFNVEINNFLMTDPVKAPHNHPSFSFSLILKGRYFEQTADGTITERPRWSRRFRSPWSFHRIIIRSGEQSWSLFVQGPEFWTWGFLCADGRVLPADAYFRANGVTHP